MHPSRIAGLLALAVAAYGQTTPFAVTLREGTPVQLRLTRDVAYATVRAGDKVDLEIGDDVRIDGVLVIGRGARLSAEIVVAEPKTRFGKGGKLGLQLESVPLMNRDQAAVRMVRESSQGPGGGAREPVLLFKFGKEDAIPDGARFTAYIAADSRLDTSRFLVDVAFTSNPPGALVSMYGSPVGRTPFTTKLAAGAYTAVFSAPGYVDLTQNLVVGPGRPSTVNAAFELH